MILTTSLIIFYGLLWNEHTHAPLKDYVESVCGVAYVG